MLEKYKNNNKDEEKPKKKRVFMRLFLYLALLILLTGLTLFAWQYLKNKKNANVLPVEKNKITRETTQDLINNYDKTDSLSNSDKVDNSDSISSSKNYKIKQVKFGGGIILANEGKKDLPLEVYDVKSEIVSSQEDGEPRFLITWRTNKEAISDVVYSKNDGSNAKTSTENGYGFEHSVLLKNMDFATIYIYKIKSNDRWGNKTSTKYFSAYTGEKSESIFDLIFNAVQEVFGWAMK